MKFLFAIGIASILVANEENTIEQFLHSSIENLVEKVEEPGKGEMVFSTEIEQDEPQIEADDSEVAELIENKEMEIELEVSYDENLEKEAAKILKEEICEEEIAEMIEPQVEDLSHLIEKPAFTTIAQPPEKETNAYEKLLITIEEQQKIRRLLTEMAENNIFKLLFEKKYLERLGHEINHVHPIRFLGTVFGDPRLVHCMHQIRRSGFKWDGFMDGFIERFQQEVKAGNVNSYVPGLAGSLGVPAADIQAYINFNDLEGLVLFLMEKMRRR